MDKKEVKTSILLKMVDEAFERKLNSQMVDIGLTSAQCRVLGFLNRQYYIHKVQEINPIDIEKHFKLKRPTVTGILKRLEEKEFIRFQPSSKDNRYKHIVLTEKSRKLHEKMEHNFANAEKILMDSISDEDLDNLRRILFIMLKNMAD